MSKLVSSSSTAGSSVDDAAAERPRRRIGLLTKTAVTLLVIGLVPLLIFGVFTLFQQRASLRSESERSLQMNAEYISAQVDEWFDKNARVLRAVVTLPAITAMQREDQAKILTAIKQAYPWMYLVFTIGLDGKNIARSDDQPLVDYSERQYFRDIVNGSRDLSWEAVLGKTSGKPSLLISIPIRGANGNLVGVLAAGMTIEETSRSIANWKSGKTGFAFLVDEKSKVLAHPRNDYVLSQKKLADHPMVAAFHADTKSHLKTFASEGGDALGFVQGNKYGWAVVVQQDEDELLGPLRATFTVGLVLLVGAILLVVAIAIAFSRMLVRPIVAMTAAADRMSMGELQTPIAWQGTDEISVLAKSLERVRKSMRAAMARLGAGA
jgi:methyl-accepting chemotaxis protein